jgi:hypothetical protein
VPTPEPLEGRRLFAFSTVDAVPDSGNNLGMAAGGVGNVYVAGYSNLSATGGRRREAADGVGNGYGFVRKMPAAAPPATFSSASITDSSRTEGTRLVEDQFGA